MGIYLLSLAFFLLGPPDRIVSNASVGPTGVDEESVAVLSYVGGQLAVLSASVRAYLPGEGLIIGTRGRIRIHSPVYRPHRLSIQLFPEPTPDTSLSSRRAGWLAWAKNNALLRALYFRCEGLVQPLLQDRSTRVVVPFVGNGYNYEAVEVMRGLRAGECESKVMPLGETLKIMECVDIMRSQWQAGSSGSSC